MDRIGQAVAKRATGFGLHVIYHDPTKETAFGAMSVGLDTLWREFDFVSLHVPLTAETRHMANAEAFNKMKPNAVLVNTSRGSVVELSGPV